jgi:hypothetical protein
MRLAILVPIVLGIASPRRGRSSAAAAAAWTRTWRATTVSTASSTTAARSTASTPRGDGGSWLTDYPLADIDLSVRLSELTKVRVSFGRPRVSRTISSCA